MKTNELMIGDWIDNNLEGKPYYVQISSISDDGEICYKKDEIYQDLWLNDNVKPIPLTKEILENNGFNGDRDVRLLKQDNFSITVVWLNDGTIDVNYFNAMDEELHLSLEYVHQLQHLLRLIRYEKEIIL